MKNAKLKMVTKIAVVLTSIVFKATVSQAAVVSIGIIPFLIPPISWALDGCGKRWEVIGIGEKFECAFMWILDEGQQEIIRDLQKEGVLAAIESKLQQGESLQSIQIPDSLVEKFGREQIEAALSTLLSATAQQ